MGCHTWFYKKVTNDEKELRIKLVNLKKEYDPLGGRRKHKYLYDKIDTVENLNLLELVTTLYEYGKFDILYKGCLYEDVPSEEYHDLWRVCSYPDDIILNLEECLESVKIYNGTDLDQDKLKEFWKEYPDGLVHYG